jgi:hypothetical protein
MHKSINFVSKHIVVCKKDEKPRTYALPVTITEDHTSKTQLQDWKQSLQGIFSVYELHFGNLTVDTWQHFIQKVKGASTDHASDQKLLIQLLVSWKARTPW